jgi:hypothetical protein
VATLVAAILQKTNMLPNIFTQQNIQSSNLLSLVRIGAGAISTKLLFSDFLADGVGETSFYIISKGLICNPFVDSNNSDIKPKIIKMNQSS